LLPLGYGALRLRSIGDNRSTMGLPWKSHCPQWLYATRKGRRIEVFRLLLSLAAVRSGADRLGTIDLPCVFFGRAIVPNGSTRRARGGVSRFFGCCSHRLRCAQSPIDWGQSIYHRSSLVEPLSPMALRDAQGAAYRGFSAVALSGYGALRLRSIGDNRSTMCLPW
jgi:hypothetical protein